MAGDWIKMGTGLGRHPKTVRIASALKADRLRAVGGLHAVWSLFDEHSDDGTLTGYSPELVDEMIGWPGFMAAMIAVEWAIVDGECLVLPRFDAHNGQSAKRRAQEADRKRSVRNVSAFNADKKRTREEKSSLSKDKEGATAWDRWNRYRNGSKGWTADGKALNKAKLETLSGGDEALAMRIVEQSIENGWRGLFPLKVDDKPALTRQPAAKSVKEALAPSETPLERALGYAKQRYERGEFGTGTDAMNAYKAECQAQTQKHRSMQ